MVGLEPGSGRSIQDVYSDGAGALFGPLGITLVFTRTAISPASGHLEAEEPEPVVQIRMSHAAAKMLAFYLARSLKSYEAMLHATIPVDRQWLEAVLPKVGGTLEEWDQFWGV